MMLALKIELKTLVCWLKLALKIALKTLVCWLKLALMILCLTIPWVAKPWDLKTFVLKIAQNDLD
jgi:hypothetical protein